MNRRVFRIYSAHVRGVNDEGKLRVARMVAEEAWTGSFSEYEERLSERLVAVHCPGQWFHGGAAGLAVGDTLLPASVTGFDPRGCGTEIPDRVQHVFLTGRRDVAATYAELAGGCVYAVAPSGRVSVDPMELRTLQLFAREKGIKRFRDADLPALPVTNFCCASATVLEVLT